MSILNPTRGAIDLESRIAYAGFGAGGGFGDGFGAGNHGLVPDRMQFGEDRRPAPYGMDRQTTLPDYGVKAPALTPDQFPIAGHQGSMIMNRHDGLQVRADCSGHGGYEPHMNYDLVGAKLGYAESALGEHHSHALWNDAAQSSNSYMERTSQTFITDWLRNLK